MITRTDPSALDRIAHIHIQAALQQPLQPARATIRGGLPVGPCHAAAMPQHDRPWAEGLLLQVILNVHLPAHITAVGVHAARGRTYGQPHLLDRQALQSLALPPDVKAAHTAQIQAPRRGQGTRCHRTAPKVLCSTAKLRIRGCWPKANWTA